MSLSPALRRILANEAEGENSGLFQILEGLVGEGEPDITLYQAVGIARCIRWVLAHGDDPDIQRFLGTMYADDLYALVELSGRKWAAYQREHNLGGQRKDV